MHYFSTYRGHKLVLALGYCLTVPGYCLTVPRQGSHFWYVCGHGRPRGPLTEGYGRHGLIHTSIELDTPGVKAPNLVLSTRVCPLGVLAGASALSAMCSGLGGGFKSIPNWQCSCCCQTPPCRRGAGLKKKNRTNQGGWRGKGTRGLARCICLAAAWAAAAGSVPRRSPVAWA
jgi:hypothetical protein